MCIAIPFHNNKIQQTHAALIFGLFLNNEIQPKREKGKEKKEKRERYIVMYKILKSIIFKVVIIVKRDRKKERKNPLIPIISII